MFKTIQIIAAIVLVLHGLIHLLGTALYLKLTETQGFSYRTTLLGGRWDLGDNGIRIFGALWVVPAVGFIIAAAALLTGWEWWRPVLVVVTLFSLVLTVVDWSIAYAGGVINIVILAVLWFGPRIATLFSR